MMNTSTIRNTTLALVGLAMAALVWPADIARATDRDLQSIEVVSLPGEQIQVRMTLSSPPPDPLSFTIDNPARIAFDLQGTRIALPHRRQDVGLGPLRSITVAEAQGRTRVVFNLSDSAPYHAVVDGNDLLVTLQTVAPAPARATIFGAAEAGRPGRPAQRDINSIDFRRGATGEGRVFVELSDPSTVVDLKDEGERVVVEFRNTRLPQALLRRMDVVDFATPVRTIDARQVGNDARLVIAGTGRYTHLAYQSDNRFTIELKPVSVAEEEEARRIQQVFTGDRLTLNFQDIEVRAVLQIIADISGFNVVVSDSVRGNLTLRLQNVPWDQALDIIMRTRGLAMRQTGNVMLIAPASEIAQHERVELESQKEIQELAPLRSEFIQINYAKASELAALLRSPTASLMSDRGNVSIDERTNTLLVQDTDERLQDVRRLVRQLDVPVRQVLIESRIVIASSDFTRELGTRFGATHVRRHGDSGVIATGGGINATDAMIGQALQNIGSSGDPFPITVPSGSQGLNDRLNVNLPSANPAGRVAFAILGSDYLIDLELSALQAEGRGEVVSSPRVLGTNQKQSHIEQGVQIPYQESSASGATTTSFQNAVLALRVTPQITPDDRVIMDLEVTADSVGTQVPSATGGFVPSIDTRRVSTQVLVDNGETVVLGGIYETTRAEVETKVPMLGDIPGVGMLFRSRRMVADKAELLIFVTPKIVKEGMRLN